VAMLETDMRSPLLLLAPVACSLAATLLLAACETQSYPPRPGEPAETAARPPVRSSSPTTDAAPIDESEAFLAIRELAQRAPTRALRAAAFRYLDLRFSSGTLGAGEPYGASAALSAPVKVTGEDRKLAFEAIVEAIRGLPDTAEPQRGLCLEPFERCSTSAGVAEGAACGDRLLLCAARELLSPEPEG